METIYVDCISDGAVFRTYEFGTPILGVPGIPPSDEELKAHAETNLTNERLAFPPYDAITFRVRR
jgi:hypothetical protein